jgi:hypothetical protein
VELEKCAICKRPLDTLDGKCGSDDAECLRIAYEREKARAEKAEAEAAEYRENCVCEEAITMRAEASLAAARRECELWKQIADDLYTPLWERGFKCEPSRNGSHVNVCGTFAAANCPLCMTDALAAPAAEEEGKHG